MHRLPLALSLLGVLLIGTPQAFAFGAPNGNVAHRILADLPSPARQTAVGAITSSAQARLPSTTFPSDFQKNVDQAVSASDADSKTFTAHLHTITYTNLGMLGGWYQEYYKSLVSGSLFVLTDLVSYYNNPDAATAAFNNASGGWTGQVTSAVCTQGQQCVQVSLPNSLVVNGHDYSAVFRMVLDSNSIFEGGYLMRQDDIAAQQASANGDLDAMTRAYLSLFTATAPAPTPSPAPSPRPTPSPTPQPTASPPTVNYQLPASYWPSGTNVTKSVVPTNDDQFIAAFHSASVASLGRIAGLGYEETAADKLSVKQKVKCGHKKCKKKVKFSVTFGYAVDVYGSSAQAATSFNDAKSSIGAPDVSSQLGAKVGDQMYVGLIRDPKDKVRAGFLVFQRGKVTVEMAVFTPYKETKFRDAGVAILARQAQWLDGQAQTQG